MASAAEQRLIKGLNGVTLLLGMLIGMGIVGMGVFQHDTAPDSFIHGRLASPEIEGPLLFFCMGAALATLWWRERLRAQLQAIWQSTAQKKTSLYLLVNGGFYMSLGVFLLIDRAFDYSLSTGLLLLGVGYLGALLWAWWYTWRRDRRVHTQP